MCIIAALRWIFDQTFSDSVLIAAVVVFGLLLLLLLSILGGWLYNRTVAGRFLLDCGPFPMRKGLLVMVASNLLMGLTCGAGLILIPGVPKIGLAGPAIWIALAAFPLIKACGRLQVRDNGIWAYSCLIPWGNIGSRQWTSDSMLLLARKGSLSFLRWTFLRWRLLDLSREYRQSVDVLLPVPPEHRQSVEELLAKRCSA